MSFIIQAKTRFPNFQYSMEEISSFVMGIWPEKRKVIEKLVRNIHVQNKNVVIPLEDYEKLSGMEMRNAIYQKELISLLHLAIEDLWKENQLTPENFLEIDAIFSTTITGISVPSIEAKLMNHFNFNPGLSRYPLFGLGCLGGLGIINRAHEFLKGHPKSLALALTYEACSLTFQKDDVSMANFISTLLFADGVGVVLLAGEEHPLAKKAKLQIEDYSCHFIPNSERVMGWDVVDTGFKIVLSGDVPDVVNTHVKDDINQYLHEKGLTLEDIKFCISHPGGPKVLKALATSLNKDDAIFQKSWDSLRDHGNISSTSIINVLEETLKNPIPAGRGLGLALGPAFNSEVTLLKSISSRR